MDPMRNVASKVSEGAASGGVGPLGDSGEDKTTRVVRKLKFHEKANLAALKGRIFLTSGGAKGIIYGTLALTALVAMLLLFPFGTAAITSGTLALFGPIGLAKVLAFLPAIKLLLVYLSAAIVFLAANQSFKKVVRAHYCTKHALVRAVTWSKDIAQVRHLLEAGWTADGKHHVLSELLRGLRWDSVEISQDRISPEKKRERLQTNQELRKLLESYLPTGGTE